MDVKRLEEIRTRLAGVSEYVNNVKAAHERPDPDREWYALDVGDLLAELEAITSPVEIWCYESGNAESKEVVLKAAMEQSDRVNIQLPYAPLIPLPIGSQILSMEREPVYDEMGSYLYTKWTVHVVDQLATPVEVAKKWPADRECACATATLMTMGCQCKSGDGRGSSRTT